MTEEMMFPVLMDHAERLSFPAAPKSIPWGVLRWHGAQVLANHEQSLEELARRGGLHPSEMYLVLHDRALGTHPLPELHVALQFMEQKVREYHEAVAGREACTKEPS